MVKVVTARLSSNFISDSCQTQKKERKKKELVASQINVPSPVYKIDKLTVSACRDYFDT